MNNCIVNEQGELLEILQEEQEKELQESQFLVPLSNYYDVLNEERYVMSVWDFTQEKWIGQGEQRPEVIPESSEIDILKQENQMIKEENQTIKETMDLILTEIIPNLGL